MRMADYTLRHVGYVVNDNAYNYIPYCQLILFKDRFGYLYEEVSSFVEVIKQVNPSRYCLLYHTSSMLTGNGLQLFDETERPMKCHNVTCADHYAAAT